MKSQGWSVKSIHHHAFSIADFLRFNEIISIEALSRSGTSNWLELASGIKNIDFLTARYDASILYCSGARDFEDSRSAILSEFVKSLATFNFIWCGLEALIENLELEEDLEHRGKINSACKFISNCFPEPSLQFYMDRLSRFIKHIEKFDKYKNIKDKLDFKGHLNWSSFGLFVVYKLRNKLAHGSYCVKR